MSGIRSPDPGMAHCRVVVEQFATPDDLPPETAALFAANPGLFSSLGWWRNVLAFGLPRESQALFLLCRVAGAPVALLPMRRTKGRLFALTTPYTCEYRPLFAPDLGHAERDSALAAVARFCRNSAYARFDALPVDLPYFQAWTASARMAGLAALRFEGFGNWCESVAGMSWQTYLASRQGALRETIRRRLRRAERDESIRFHVLHSAREIEAGVAAYEHVYARSWKPAEPFPGFIPGLLRTGAEAGWLRLALLRQADQPIAVQLWSVEHGSAMVHKLAHDEGAKALSPGTVLTAFMLRHLLDAEHVTEIDFGRGDDEYKRGWAGRRRQRVGLVLANPLRPAGMAVLLRHAIGRMRKPSQPDAAPADATRA